VKAWKAALAAALATAAISFVALAPAAQSGKTAGKLKITTAHKSGTAMALATCPKGYVVIGGGFSAIEGNVINNQKQDEDSWIVQTAPPGGKRRLGDVNASAVCAKGANGLKVVDSGNEKTNGR
jgi:hypothetical protein